MVGIDHIFSSTQKFIINDCCAIVFDVRITDHKASLAFLPVNRNYILNENKRKFIKNIKYKKLKGEFHY